MQARGNMKNHTAVAIAAAVLFATWLRAAETAVKMTELPPAVQAAVKEQTKNATLVGLSREKENGKTTYEAETTVNGKSRDVSFSQTGAILSVEQEVDLDSLPAAAKSAILKKLGKAQLKKVELVTVGSTVSYEATIDRNGKASEISVNQDGSPHKE